MMLKLQNGYLEFNEPIELERKAKLFEAIDEIDGDVSFESSCELSSHNINVLGFPFPDSSSKIVYTTIDADLLTDQGLIISRGFIRIERKINRILTFSFWSGNSNWFRMLTGNMADLDLNEFDTDQTESNIVNSWSNTDGITFPLIDTGALSTRSFSNSKLEDYTSFLYVKTLMKKIFQSSGLKLQGELLNNWRYNNLGVVSNGRSQAQVQNRSSFVKKNIPQAIGFAFSELVTFDDDSTYPYFDGSLNNYSLPFSRYTADIKMRVNISVSVSLSSSVGGNLIIRVNGLSVRSILSLTSSISLNANLSLNAGDYVEIFFRASFPSTLDVESATFKLTPTYLYKFFGKASVPRWTKQDFVAQLISVFNTVPSYDPYTKTVTLNLFDKIKEKQPIDISEYINSVEEDYIDFISSYGRQNTFLYQETDIPNLQEYNISTFIKYGAGVLSVDNDFISESEEVLEIDFAAPISYLNGAFNISLERISFVELEDDINTSIDSVVDSVSDPGVAEFHLGSDIVIVGDLVRITDSTIESYNGEWVVGAQTGAVIRLMGVDYNGDATATITKIIHQFTTDDNVYLFLNVPNYQIPDMSPLPYFFLETTNYTTQGLAYFNLLNTGRQINIDFKQGLSFGIIENPLFYQRTILQDYWSSFERILNDPVKLKQDANLPWRIHNQIDFLRPIVIRSKETSNLYYCNLERGYQGSHIACQLELIKLP